MKILRAGDHRRMPWKNGRGETVEIAVFPPDATVDTFDWRVSMATVSEDGAFSIFPGIDRTLSILQGDGMELTIEGSEPVRLTQNSAPHAFPADIPTSARLAGGTVTDLNVMTRRGCFTHRLTELGAPLTLQPEDGDLMVMCLHGELDLSSHSGCVRLGAYDCAALTLRQSVDVSGKGRGFIISIRSCRHRDKL